MLPQSLLDLLPPPAPAVPGVPTGVQELDEALPGGGLPRGRLTEIVGGPGSGQATLLRRIAEETIARGEWVGYIDASRTLAPRDWAHLGSTEGLWVIRPTDPQRAAWCADVLLRSGAFSLVVLDSAPPLSRAVAVRLTRLARESSAALVVAGTDAEGRGGSMLGGAVKLEVGRRARGPKSSTLHPPRPAAQSRRPPPAAWRPPSGRWPGAAELIRQLVIVVQKGGTRRTVEVGCAIGVARRLCTHSQVPDRRGVARGATGRSGSERRAAPAALSTSGGGAGGELHGDPNDGGGPRVLARKRRCAEPEYGRHTLPAALRPPAAAHPETRSGARALG